MVKKEICWECTGAGRGLHVPYCKVCKGSGYLQIVTCPTCKGTGKNGPNKCLSCGGNGTIEIPFEITKT